MDILRRCRHCRYPLGPSFVMAVSSTPGAQLFTRMITGRGLSMVGIGNYYNKCIKEYQLIDLYFLGHE